MLPYVQSVMDKILISLTVDKQIINRIHLSLISKYNSISFNDSFYNIGKQNDIIIEIYYPMFNYYAFTPANSNNIIFIKKQNYE